MLFGALSYLLFLVIQMGLAWRLLRPRCRQLPTEAVLAGAVAGQWILTAGLVQLVGLVGFLRRPALLVVFLVLCTVAAFVCRRLDSVQTCRRSGTDRRTAPFGMAWLAIPTAAVAAVCVGRGSLVEGMDSLTMHGPLVVEWLQQGRVTLAWQWNYPLLWEFQAAANLLLCGSDAFIGVLRVQAACCLGLALVATGRLLGLGRARSWLMALLLLLSPLVWGVVGEGTLKSDLPLACGLTLGLVALLCALRKQPTLWLFAPALGCIVGSKATGAVYAGGLLVAYGLLQLPWRFDLVTWLRGAGLLAVACTIGGSVQIANLLTNGSPFHPIQFEIGPFVLFPGTGLVKGTSLLEAGAATGWLPGYAWGSVAMAGPVITLALLGLPLTFIVLAWRWLRRSGESEVSRRSSLLVGLFAVVLLALFAATPWTAGLTPGSGEYLESAKSLRFGLAAVAVAAIAFVDAFLRRVPLALLAAVQPLVLVWKWRLAISEDLLLFAAGALCGAVLSLVARRPELRRVPAALRRPLPAVAAGLVVSLVVVAGVETWVEHRRVSHWGSSTPRAMHHRPLTLAVRDLGPGQTIALGLPDGAKFRYLFYGPRLDNRLVPITNATQQHETAQLVWLQVRRDRRREVLRRWRRAGWSVRAQGKGSSGLLLEYAPGTSSPP